MDLIREINKQLKKIVSILDKREEEKIKDSFRLPETLAKSKRWQDVLIKIFEYAPNRYGYRADGTLLKDLEKLKMFELELELCMAFLEDNKLIERIISKEGGRGSIGLTQRGFDVSFEIEKIKSEKRFRWYTIIISTLALIISIVSIITRH